MKEKKIDWPYSTPIILPEQEVLNEWLDYNGHMNEARYLDCFCEATDEFMKNNEGSVHSVTRHILGLYNSLPGAKEWRRELTENARFSKNGDLLRFATDNIEEFIHRKSLILA